MNIKDLALIKNCISESYDLINELFIEIENIIHLTGNRKRSKLTYLRCGLELLKNIKWAM